jgi:hypothetical protein
MLRPYGGASQYHDSVKVIGHHDELINGYPVEMLRHLKPRLLYETTDTRVAE